MLTPSVLELTVPARYNGPAGSAHGGYTCGRLAALAVPGPAAAVTLLKPPPLATPMRLRPGAHRSALWCGDELIATATPTDARIQAPAPVLVAEATAAENGFLGRTGHPFPTCFACGHARTDGIGLRLAPGPVAGRPHTTACVWRPADTAAETVWSALDCAGGWTADPRRRPAVLTKMTARLLRPPRVGAPHVLVGWRKDDHGRTATNVTACYDADGELLAVASAVWTKRAG
ncbi:hypothetical protein [Streptomyces litchfieldiae]|uniref:Uncharacterized protein n=1 Tax=Streptomyces litchfieldiae TaxID=3075543 RepID=A0ABU2MQL8_9ACTN|nr:hypothetical protein [Streptomyces sp. DSM 44938]MDT0343925.1 hypothetical protein [Streptomyces sp. DSM 44938]